MPPAGRKRSNAAPAPEGEAPALPDLATLHQLRDRLVADAKDAPTIEGEPPQYRPGTALLAAKLSWVLGQLERVPKRGRNDHFNYDFATESDVADALRRHLSEVNVAVIASGTVRDIRPAKTSRGKDTLLTDVTTALTFICGDTGAELVATMPGTGDDPSDKGTYKGVTGAMKYVLLKTFMMSTGDDPETVNPEDKAASGGARQQQQQRPPAEMSEAHKKKLRGMWAKARELGVEPWDVRRLAAFTNGVLSTKEIPQGRIVHFQKDMEWFAENREAAEQQLEKWAGDNVELAAKLDLLVAEDKGKDTPFGAEGADPEQAGAKEPDPDDEPDGSAEDTDDGEGYPG